ncbi:hypothetical protein BN2475_860038 [Paraburkholderia ribeironis]|uniref:Uncharacterized protein n=1 Tax=Paraburkholderia ribeironis TaxID=1247936 RepID=A0A1N7SKS5_9BURK|nr:hypothetical protein BN2475_860038 [Paraburkholderia ribeironis]
MVCVVRQGDWQGALRVALPSCVINSIVAIGWDACRDRRDRRRERRDVALEVALSLEKTALQIAGEIEIVARLLRHSV